MALDGCGQIYKYILIIFNIIVAVEGFVMFGLGLWLRTRSEISGMFPTDTNALVIGVTMLCVSGTLFLLVAAFGGYGAWRENRTALGVFAVLMGILAVVQIVIGGISYIKMNGLGEQVGDLYIFLYKRVATTGGRDISDVLTKLHHALQCCGLVGALDLLVQKTCPKVGHLETLTYPACPPVILDLYKASGQQVIGLFLGTAALLLAVLACSCILIKQIKMSRQSNPAQYSQAIH